MHNLEFTPEEVEVLRDTLRHQLVDLDVEVLRTDTHDYKQMLKHRRTLLEHVLMKLKDLPVAA